MGRIRILRVIGRLNVGGPAAHVTLLTTRLDPSRYETTVVAGHEEAAEGNYLSLHGRSLPRLIVLPELRREIRLWTDLRALARLYRLIRRLRPHIVDTHTAKAGALGRLAAWLARDPVVIHTYHGHVFDGYFSPFRTRLYLGIDRWLARRTDRIIAVGDAVRGGLLALGVGTPDRVRVILPAIEIAPFLAAERLRGQLRAELGFGPVDPVVGIVARLVPIKAHEVFLEAAVSVARAVPESRFVVVGDGERRAELEAYARCLGLEARVRFLGWRHDMDRVYADQDLVVLCSRNEGTPLCLMEAMAAGRPVVATRVGGVVDVVEDGVTGRLVPPGDAPTLAGAIVDLLQAPECRGRLGAAGRARARSCFEAARLVAEMDGLYTALVEDGCTYP